jgi:hypothetical protein
VIPLILRMISAEAAMMGRQTGDQASLFYEFRLDDRIPKDHLLRRINVFVGPVMGGVRGRLKSYYSEIGRPSIDPELMIRMLIVGYCFAMALTAAALAERPQDMHHQVATPSCQALVAVDRAGRSPGSPARSRAATCPCSSSFTSGASIGVEVPARR